MELLKQNYVKYGLIMCAVLLVCLCLMEITGQNQSFDNKSPFQFIFMFIAPFVVWWLGIAAKKKLLKNKMTFKQGLSEGFKISLAYGIVSPFIFLFYYVFINPDIVAYVKVAYNLSEAQDAVVIGVDMLAQLIAAIVFGTLYAAIISLFLKSKN